MRSSPRVYFSAIHSAGFALTQRNLLTLSWKIPKNDGCTAIATNVAVVQFRSTNYCPTKVAKAQKYQLTALKQNYFTQQHEHIHGIYSGELLILCAEYIASAPHNYDCGIFGAWCYR